MSARVVVAPDWPPARGVFLAGGITGCPDWQAEAIDRLGDLDVTIFNPRRSGFPMGDPTAGYDQIAWEYRALRAAEAILFWFPAEQVQPIALYELGTWSWGPKPIFIGAHPEYPRRFDIEVQTNLGHPGSIIHPTLEATCDAVRAWWG